MRGMRAAVAVMVLAWAGVAAGQSGPARMTPLVAPEGGTCTAEAEDLRFPACSRAAFEDRLMLVYAAGARAVACKRRDGRWTEDFGTVVGTLAVTARDGSEDRPIGGAMAARIRARMSGVLQEVQDEVRAVGVRDACRALDMRAPWLAQADAMVAWHRAETARFLACLRRDRPEEDCGIPRVDGAGQR